MAYRQWQVILVWVCAFSLFGKKEVVFDSSFLLVRKQLLPAGSGFSWEKRRLKETLHDWCLSALSVDRKQNKGWGWRWLVCTAETLPMEDKALAFRGWTGITWLSLRFKTAAMVLISFTGLIRDMRGMVCPVYVVFSGQAFAPLQCLCLCVWDCLFSVQLWQKYGHKTADMWI